MNLFGLDIKYIVLLVLAVLLILSFIKKMFKLAITIAILAVIYYVVKLFL